MTLEVLHQSLLKEPYYPSVDGMPFLVIKDLQSTSQDGPLPRMVEFPHYEDLNRFKCLRMSFPCFDLQIHRLPSHNIFSILSRT